MDTIASERGSAFLEKRIAPPDGSKEPLEANVFDRMAGANCQLLPLFPYLGPGAIVPCGAIFNGSPGAEFGHFFHFNTAQEVVLCFAGSKGMMTTGQVFATQPLHGVNSFLRAPPDPDAFLVLTVTQRQEEQGEQKEAVIFRCQSCHADLVRHEYDVTPTGTSAEDVGVEPFLTIIESARAVDLVEQSRTCAKCGTVTEAFPGDVWGWRRYAEQTRTANAGRRELDERATAVRQPAAT